jgi:phenylalanyl-tRNA synthetase beta chain
MKIALSWLSAYLRKLPDVDTISHALTDMGLEVEHIEGYAAPIKGVVVAHIRQFAPHPSADKLRVATVFDGEKEIQVVCGDLTCPEGAKVPLAVIGAKLPGGFEIKKAKLRGIDSMGMLCARDELGFNESSDGVFLLPEEAVCGKNAFEWMNDPVFCLSLTPNLGYCLSIEAVAKQLCAKLEIEFVEPKRNPLLSTAASSPGPQVVDKSGKCSQYHGLLIENISVGPSPKWLARSIEQAGYRSVNSLVDAANWVMLQTGRPIHLFDADTLKGNLLVTLEPSPKVFKRIDGIENPLAQGVLCINDEEETVAVAGVMGSQLHEVGFHTQRVFMEVAVFDPSIIRKSARSIGCSSEASRRFERGVDPSSTSKVFEYFISCLHQLGLEPVYGECSGFGSDLKPKRKIQLSSSLVERLLDMRMSAREMATWLERLDIECEVTSHETLTAHVPFARHDLVIACDLVEEIMKLVGTQNLPRKPLTCQMGRSEHDPRFVLTQNLRKYLWGYGLNEVITLDMVSSAKCQQMGMSSKLVYLKNPATVDQDVLRPSLLVSFLESVAHNRDQQVQDLSFFEIGSLYALGEGQTQEQLALGLMMSGKNQPAFWSHIDEKVDFYTLKGLVEQILAYLGIEAAFEKSQSESFHPGQQAKIVLKSGFVIGHIGRLHPRFEQALEWQNPLFYAELGLEDLMKAQDLRCMHQSLAQYPGSERDWTLTVEEAVAFDQIKQAIPELEQLEKVEVVSIWRCPQKLGAGKKNITLRFFYRHRDKTMTQPEVEAQHLLLKETVFRKLDLKI